MGTVYRKTIITGTVERESFVPYHIVSYWRHGQTSFCILQTACLLAVQERETTYSTTINRLHCTITFSLLRLAVQSIHGAHSAFHRPDNGTHVDYVISLSNLQINFFIAQLCSPYSVLYCKTKLI